MRLDDIESADVSKAEQYLAQIKVLRQIAEKMVNFLAQLEDFQINGVNHLPDAATLVALHPTIVASDSNSLAHQKVLNGLIGSAIDKDIISSQDT